MISWIWLSQLKGIGPLTQRLLLHYFHTPSRIFDADEKELLACDGIGKEKVGLILSSRSQEKAKLIYDQCIKKGISILTLYDSRYPAIASQISDMPILLYYKGILKPDSSGIGIVGSRRCTDYGKSITVDCASFLVQHGISVIRGMAKGIDSYAHTACLKAGGYTIAVLGNGIDLCYPSEHRTLMEQIAEHGLLLSEYEPGQRPNQHHFPRRNRIISAWSQKLLIVEAGERSGSLITADFSRKYGHEVFAVPGRLDAPESAGSNQLLAQGANVFLHNEQLLPSFDLASSTVKTNITTETKEPSTLSRYEQDILQLMHRTSANMPISIAQMEQKLQLSHEIMLNSLLSLELLDFVNIRGDIVYYKHS